VEEQIDHALGFAAVAEEAAGGPPLRTLDLGSGGGLPGLVLIELWPTADVVLLDSMAKRTEFLRDVVPSVGRGTGVVVLARAEEAGRDPSLREGFDLVTARSFGAPGVTAECASAFLATGGHLVVSEPPGEERSVRWEAPALDTLGLRSVGYRRVGDRFGYQLLRKIAPLDDRYPRRTGIPGKRPLF
jgi:16S rRNA (guanine527-N7)-methyltransferase